MSGIEKKIIVFIVIMSAATLLFSSCGRVKHADIDKSFRSAVSGFGGKVVIYEPFSNSEPSREIITLFGRDGKAPDEFSLIEYMEVWYSECPSGGDAAVFYAVNATDTASIVKMCERRARTLKHSAGIKSEIFVSGHFVVFVHCSGEYEGIKDGLVREFAKRRNATPPPQV